MNVGTALEDFRRTNQRDLVMQNLSKFRLRYRWTRPEVHIVRALRRAELFRELADSNRLLWPFYLLSRWRYQKLTSHLGLTIPLGVFADGLSLAHVGTITVNKDASVGRNCRLHPGVTIGATRGNAPTIGDDVFIGPNVVIVGDIHIGNRCHIGPGCVVNIDVPPDTVLLAQLPQQKSRTRPTWQSERYSRTSPN